MLYVWVRNSVVTKLSCSSSDSLTRLQWVSKGLQLSEGLTRTGGFKMEHSPGCRLGLAVGKRPPLLYSWASPQAAWVSSDMVTVFPQDEWTERETEKEKREQEREKERGKRREREPGKSIHFYHSCLLEVSHYIWPIIKKSENRFCILKGGTLKNFQTYFKITAKQRVNIFNLQMK